MEQDFLRIMVMLGAVVLFVFSLYELTDQLKRVAGSRIRAVVDFATRTLVHAFISGIVVAVMLGSSSMAIIVAIGFVRAGLLPAGRAFPYVLGANIGTSLKSLLFSLPFNEYAPILMAIALAIRLGCKRDSTRHVASLLFSIGLVFFSLYLIEFSSRVYRDDPRVIDWLKSLDSPSTGVLAGAVVTSIIQSSSAMMGIIIALAREGCLTLPLGLAIMFGAEVGTCLDTLVASLGSDRAAWRVGLFQLLVNLSTVAIWLPLIQVMAGLVSGLSNELSYQLAIAHVTLNVSISLLWLVILALAKRRWWFVEA